jgi:hypothetical protein
MAEKKETKRPPTAPKPQIKDLPAKNTNGVKGGRYIEI